MDLKRGKGIEQIPESVITPDGNFRVSFPGWGKQRAHLDPIDVPDNYGRDEYSFYFHDSTKGYTHGCIEIDSTFFDDLKDYRKTNDYIEVMVKYEDGGASTYGETDK